VAALLIAFGVLMGLGGIAAYRRRDSKPALIVGAFIGMLLILCGGLAWMGFRVGSYSGFVLSLLMALLFTSRYRKTKQVPSAVMMVVSFAVVVTGAYLLFV